jgi:serine/threonine protein kinase
MDILNLQISDSQKKTWEIRIYQKRFVDHLLVNNSFLFNLIDLAPEMVRKKGITKSADIYGVGCVWYEMLTGEAPFMDDDLEKLTRKIELGKLNFPSFVKEESKKAIRVFFFI